ncbi:hypothetical protein COTS27_01652 [Spirochaetota bacterium]|nr:hypothetical protein COTS27_01652 [Spirochaetota bacterium]
MGAMSPGPDFFIIIKNSLQYKFKYVTMTACGIALGCTLHVGFAIFGIAAVSTYLNELLVVLQFAGATYLFYLGLTALRTQRSEVNITTTMKTQETEPLEVANVTKKVGNSKRTLKSAFLEGFLCNVLNVKAAIFFISIFSYFLVGTNKSLWIHVIYVVGIPLQVLVWFTLLGRLLTIPGFKARLVRYQVHLMRIMGLVLIGIALFTLTIEIF